MRQTTRVRFGSPLLLAAGLLGAAAGCGHAPAPATGSDRPETGLATFYASSFQGARTANGERYDENDLTAAHRTLPFGTRVRVTHLENGRQVEVRINDRGPWIEGRVIDLSRKAAEALEMIRDGKVRVRIEVLQAEAAGSVR